MENEELETINGLDRKEAWRKRRRVIYLTMLLTAAYLIYILTLNEEPSQIISTITSGLTTICTWIALGWMFGSVVDDRLKGTINGIPIKDAWKKRRLVIYSILLYSVLVIVYLTFFYPLKEELIIHNEVTKHLFELNTWILLGWLFGSLMDENWFSLKMKGKLDGKTF